jgi:hypothetical protein
MGAKLRPTADSPLTVTIQNGRLVISIGIATNAWAALRAPFMFDEAGRDGAGRGFRVTSHTGFAQDTRRALTDEREDGSSLLTDMFDAAYLRAFEDGSEHVRGPDDLEDEAE